jgi:hypothetical protein
MNFLRKGGKTCQGFSCVLKSKNHVHAISEFRTKSRFLLILTLNLPASSSMINCTKLAENKSSITQSTIDPLSMGAIKSGSPSWFLDHCVTTPDEWNTRPDALIVRDTESVDRNSRGRLGGLTSTTYEIESALYNVLGSVVRRSCGSSKPSREKHVYFTHDALLLRFPNDGLGSRFLACVVEHFARSIGAHLIMFTLDVIKELVAQVAVPEEKGLSITIDDAMGIAFEDPEVSGLNDRDLAVLFEDAETSADDLIKVPDKGKVGDVLKVSHVLEFVQFRIGIDFSNQETVSSY